MVSTVCGHIFCKDCIQIVIKTSKNCPKCRRKLSQKQYHPIFFWKMNLSNNFVNSLHFNQLIIPKVILALFLFTFFPSTRKVTCFFWIDHLTWFKIYQSLINKKKKRSKFNLVANLASCFLLPLNSFSKQTQINSLSC